MSSGDLLQFGEFSLDPNIPVLMAGSSLVELPPKALEILLVLLRNAGQVVLNRDLLDLLWPDTAVEEGNITVYVSYLRRALGDGRLNQPTLIETVPKRGYRFAATVRRVRRPDLNVVSEPANLGLSAARYMDLWTITGSRKATALLRRYIEAEPESGWAHAMLALSLLTDRLLTSANNELATREASNHLNEAERMDPSCPYIHGARAAWDAGVQWKWDEAEEAAQQAVELSIDPHTRDIARTTLGCYLIRRGEVEFGYRELPEPKIEHCLCPLVWITHSEARFLAREFVASLKILEQALDFYPHHWLLHLCRAKALAALNDFHGALRSLRRAKLLSEDPSAALDAEIARVKALMGKSEGAVLLLKNRWDLAPVAAAKVHCALGDKDGALARIEEACAARDWYICDLKQDCGLDGLRSDLRFQRLLGSIGI